MAAGMRPWPSHGPSPMRRSTFTPRTAATAPTRRPATDSHSEAGADIVVMLHPDYQYTPRLIPAMASLLASGLYPCVLGSRILGGYALRGGMPIWKYVANRFLTAVENVVLGAKLSEYHTGYRAFSAELLRSLPLASCSEGFRLRQRDAGADRVGGRHGRGSELPDSLRAGVVIDQSARQCRVRVRVSPHDARVLAGEDRAGQLFTVPARTQEHVANSADSSGTPPGAVTAY